MEKNKEKYPVHVFLIVAHEFFERYAYYGVRSVLVIYLVSNYIIIETCLPLEFRKTTWTLEMI